MYKDGTARGGVRVGTGRKVNALADKITIGRPADVLSFSKHWRWNSNGGFRVEMCYLDLLKS